jgi:hypothetical protein
MASCRKMFFFLSWILILFQNSQSPSLCQCWLKRNTRGLKFGFSKPKKNSWNGVSKQLRYCTAYVPTNARMVLFKVKIILKYCFLFFPHSLSIFFIHFIHFSSFFLYYCRVKIGSESFELISPLCMKTEILPLISSYLFVKVYVWTTTLCFLNWLVHNLWGGLVKAKAQLQIENCL